MKIEIFAAKHQNRTIYRYVITIKIYSFLMIFSNNILSILISSTKYICWFWFPLSKQYSCFNSNNNSNNTYNDNNSNNDDISNSNNNNNNNSMINKYTMKKMGKKYLFIYLHFIYNLFVYVHYNPYI